jgi:hypothetical protein
MVILLSTLLLLVVAEVVELMVDMPQVVEVQEDLELMLQDIH